jgi:acetylglutamate kinase
MSGVMLIKIGGHDLEDAAFLHDLAVTVKQLDRSVVIVHGGGQEISALQRKLGIEPRYHQGVRITDAESLAVVTMVLCGIVNKRLVRHLVTAGVDALGLSGVDRGLIHADPMRVADVEMGFTGAVTAVRAEVLTALLDTGVTPVIAPICLGDSGTYNVNADHVAGAVAVAVEATQVVFLTNVDGVLIDGQVARRLTVAETRDLIDQEVITGGMIPKVETALAVVEAGLDRVTITNLAGLVTHGGTTFSGEQA